MIGAVTYFLLMEHRQHLFQWLPFLIIALCPLMHLFMHGGHGGHEDHEGHEGHEGHDHKGSRHKNKENTAYRRGLEEGRKQSVRHHDSSGER